jgi:hypothetical protein
VSLGILALGTSAVLASEALKGSNTPFMTRQACSFVTELSEGTLSNMDWPKSPLFLFRYPARAATYKHDSLARERSHCHRVNLQLCLYGWQCKRRICQARDGAHIQFENLEQNLGDDFQILFSTAKMKHQIIAKTTKHLGGLFAYHSS